MSCVFRIAGASLNVDQLLAAVPLQAHRSFRKGEPVVKSLPRGRKLRKSGANFVISKANMANFGKQKRDAIAFLKTKRATIRRIVKWPGVDFAEFDFGIDESDVPFCQEEYLPAELLKLAGDLGLDISISIYRRCDEKGKHSKIRKNSGSR